jgi:hypothetical protein
MTDRHAGYLVTLDHDIREDDAGEIIAALRMIKFVAAVEPVTTDLVQERIVQLRRDIAWQEALSGAVRAMRES